MAEERFRVRLDKKFRLEDHDPGFTGRFESKEDGQRHLQQGLTDRIWKERYEDIGAFERYVSRNGTVIRKFFLNVSREEQRKRFLGRLDEPEKNWKFAAADVEERRHWDEYVKAYEKRIEATTSEEAPWFVIPADHKWFTRLAVADVIVETLQGLDLHFPEVSEAQRQELKRARALLEGD